MSEYQPFSRGRGREKFCFLSFSLHLYPPTPPPPFRPSGPDTQAEEVFVFLVWTGTVHLSPKIPILQKGQKSPTQAFCFVTQRSPTPQEGGALLLAPCSPDIAPPSYLSERLNQARQGHRVGTGYEQGTQEGGGVSKEIGGSVLMPV